MTRSRTYYAISIDAILVALLLTSTGHDALRGVLLLALGAVALVIGVKAYRKRATAISPLAPTSKNEPPA